MSTLLVHKTTTEDAGLYRCEVINDLGSVDSEAVVTVTGIFVIPIKILNYTFSMRNCIYRIIVCLF